MSKTLFNQNTFQSKNVTNSDDVSDLKVDTFKAINLTATNIINAELQAATSGVATNLTAIANKQDTLTTGDGIDITNDVIKFDGSDLDQDIDVGSAYEIKGGTMYYYAATGAGGTIRQVNIQTKIEANETAIGNKQDVLSASNKLSPNFITAEDAIEDAVTITDAEFGALNGFNATAGSIQTQLSAKVSTSGTPLQIEVDGDEVAAILATAAGSSNFGLITGNVLETELSGKQDSFTVTNGIQINSNVLSLTGSYSGSFDITGPDFIIWNETRGGVSDPTAPGRVAVHQNIGTPGSKATSVLRINYNSDFGAGTKIDSITGIKTNPDSNYDLKVNGNTDIGGVLSIDGYSNVKTALDAAGGGLVYTALANGGLAVNGNAFSVDLTNTNADFEIPQAVHIEQNGTPQLLVEPASVNSNDAEIEIRGARNGSTSAGQAKLVFSNYDNDLTATNSLGRIDGRVSNAGTNIGGLVFSTFADGSTRTGHLSLSAAGNLGLGSGDTFQDDYKLKVTGNTKLIGNNFIKTQLRHFGYDKDLILGDTGTAGNWGNGSTQIDIVSDRRVGDSFCSTNAGTITLTANGYYRIRVSAQTQSDGYNDRVSFMNYLRIVSSGTTTNYDEQQNYNFFGWNYIRNNTDGGHGSVSFEDFIYLTSGSSISPRQKLETGGNRDFGNTLPAANIDNYLNITIERVYDEDPEV